MSEKRRIGKKKLVGYIESEQILVGTLMSHKTKTADCKVSVEYDKVSMTGKIVIDLPDNLSYLAMDYEQVH